MTPLKVSALATDSCSENSTKAKRVGWVSSPAIRTNFTLPTCLKNSSSCSAVVVCRQKESGTPSTSWPLTWGRCPALIPAEPTFSYLRVQVADIDGSPDLINLCWVHIAHEGRLRGHRCCDFQTSWHPIHYWKVELQEEQHHQVSLACAARQNEDWLTFWSGFGAGMGSSPPPGIRLGTGVEGAKSDKALASSGIFPAGQKDWFSEGSSRLLLSPLCLHN